MPWAGALILLGVFGYFGFQAIDAAGLADQSGIAAVLGKQITPFKKTYRTDYIAGRTQVIPQFVPERYVIRLRVDNGEAYAVVDRDLFDAARDGDRVAVTYQRTRLTGKIRILSARPEKASEQL